jgi:hypothetical protein
MCSFTDTQAAPTSYTMQAQKFLPQFWFWPASLALNNTLLVADQIFTTPSAVASQGTLGVSIVAEQCHSGGAPYRRTPIWIQCLASDNGGGSGSMAAVLQQQDLGNNGPAVNSKGRLNFGKPISAPNDILTLQDSNFAKTITANGERPANDAGDMAIGMDRAGGLSLRAQESVSNYIGVRPSGSNYLERLTSSMKSFAVPLQTTPVTVSALPVCTPETEGAMRAVKDSATNTLGAIIAGRGLSHVLAYCDGSNWTVAAK